VEKYGTARQTTDDSTMWRMRFAWWITKAKDTHSEYVIHVAFPQPELLGEHASVLIYTYVCCRVTRTIQIKLFSDPR
jgi:hypothetical protein